MSEAKSMQAYGLEPIRIEEVDLHACHVFHPPNNPMNDLFRDNRLMSFSPHAELCSLYLLNGSKWLKKNYRSTRYGKMLERMGKNGFPQKIVDICESMKQGYLRRGYEESPVVVLLEPFAMSRYERKVPAWTPEIWSGHHRAGALLALGYSVVKVLVAKDICPGSKFSVGKVHGLCREEA